MKKISILMYSTFEGSGYKAPILKPLLIELNKRRLFNLAYGIKFSNSKISNHIYKLFRLPVLASSLIKFLSRFGITNDKYSYLIGEIVFGQLIKNSLLKDNSELYFTKPRPYNLIKILKSLHKKVIVEASEMHPEFSLNVLQNERKIFGIRNKSIYENKYAVNDFKRSLIHSDKIVVLSSKSLQSYLDYGISKDKLVLIRLGIDDSFDNKIILYDERKEIAFFSTANHSLIKGTHRLLLIWKKYKIQSKLFIVGDLRTDIKEFIKKYGPFDNVVFTNSINRENLSQLYSQFNPIGCLLSLSEGYGRAVAEYLQLGIPVIVSDVCDLDKIQNSINGYVVSPYDDELIVNAIIDLTSTDNYVRIQKNNIKLKLDKTKDYIQNLSNFLEEQLC
jgi:glycosyltransferase involved in cell wall biosynthesis